MGKLLTGPQPLIQVRDQGPGLALVAPPGAASLVVAHLRVLWNLTSPVDDTATPGSVCVCREIIEPNPAKQPPTMHDTHNHGHPPHHGLWTFRGQNPPHNDETTVNRARRGVVGK
jgi:hypothetical protein